MPRKKKEKKIEVEDPAYADTDSDMECTTESQQEEAKQSNIPKLFRLSSRVVSLKRRGKFQAPREENEEFDFYAEDYITVRAPDQKFYLCRVLEDVATKNDQVNIAWYDKVSKNRYKVSYDDTIYKTTVLTHVQIKEVSENPDLYYIPIRFIKETQELLKESVENAGEEYNPNLTSSEDEDVQEADDNDSETEPASKKKRSNRGSAKKTKRKQSTSPAKVAKTGSKREKVSTPKRTQKRTKGLIPNPEIKLLENDPTFCKGSKVPLINVKQAIRAVLSDDKDLLKELIADVKNVYSVQWERSYNVNSTPMQCAILKQDKKFIELLEDARKNRRNVTATRPVVDFNRKDSGSYNFHTFGHAVREITVSRGNKEGDNALLYADGEGDDDFKTILPFALKCNTSFDLIWECFIKKDEVLNYESELFDVMYIAIMNGHLELAGKIMEKAVDNGGYGFNFLHKEVLVNKNQPLTPFKAASVTKKTYLAKKVAPIHCACINPNVMYIEELCKVFEEYNFPDWQDSRPVHYAAACVGDGPLKFLLQRGVDPNSQNKVLKTPLIIAAICNRVHNINALMSCTIDLEDENGELKKQVNINGKSKSTKTALHYAAKKGHVDSVKALIAHGAKVDIQTAASKENMTPLGYAAAKGHYDVVKLLIENGANPEFRMRRRKTALIYACMNGHSQIVAYLLNIGVNPDAADSSDNTPLHYAAAYGWFYCVKLLLEAGANPSTSNNWKTTALSISLLKQHLEIGDLLLSCDVDVNLPDDQGRTLLMKNVNVDFSEKQLKLVEHLIHHHKADVSITDIDGWSALHYLASNTVYIQRWEGRLKYWQSYVRSRNTTRENINVKQFSKGLSDICVGVAKVMIKAGGDVNGLNNDGETPMMIAIRQHNYPLIQILMENGALPAIGCSKKSNEKMLHIAVKNAAVPLPNVILEELFPDDDMTALPTVDFDKQYENIDDFLKIYEKIDEERKNLQKKAKTRLVMAILDSKLDVNELLPTGVSAFMIAVEHKSIELCELLLKHSGNPEIGQNTQGENILHILARQCAECEAEEILIKMLESVPAFSSDFVNRLDDKGYTPFIKAALVYHNVGSGDKANNKRIKSFIQLLITRCGADISIRVGTEKVDEKKVESKEKYGEHGKMNALFFLQKCDNTCEQSESILHMIVDHLGANKELFNQRDCNGRTLIHYALHTKIANLKTMKYLVESGCNVNLPSENLKEDRNGISLLKAAEWKSDENILYFLIDLTKDVNAGNSIGVTVAHNVAFSDKSAAVKIELFKRLLAKGLKINCQDNNGRTALHYAVAKACGDYEEMTEFEEFVIANGAKVDIACNEGRYPLHYAFTQLEKEPSSKNRDPMSLVKLLCEVKEEGLDGKSFKDYVNHRDNYRRTALHYGCLNGATISCSKLKKHFADDSIEDVDGNTPLSLALKHSKHGCVMTMLQHGASPLCDIITSVTKAQLKTYKEKLERNPWIWHHKVAEPKGSISSAFQVAIQKDWKDIAYLMLEVSGLPLFCALKAGIKESKKNLIVTLLSKQRDNEPLLGKDKENRNLLHLIAKHTRSTDIDRETGGDYSKYYDSKNDVLIQPLPYVKNFSGERDLSKLFINAGVKLTDVDSKGKTPLHYAVKHNLYLAEFFMKIAPNQLHVKDQYGRTPLAVLVHALNKKCDQNMSVMIRRCIGAGANSNVCYKEKSKTVSTSLINTAILLKDKEFVADFKTSTNILDILLEEGADVNFATNEGVTPLMLAIRLNYKDIVHQLLRHKPKMKVQDEDGNSYVHACVQTLEYGSHENVEILKKLMKAGAPTDLKNKNNETPLDLARKQQSGVMEKLLSRKDDNTRMDIDNVPESGFVFEKEKPTINFHYDYIADAEAEIKRCIGDIVKDHDHTVMVDPALDMSKTGEVYYDPVENKPYDVILTRVDTKYGAWGLNLFYKLQVIRHKGKNLWILFNRWGRIGDNQGQHQQTPFDTAEEAVTQFKKIFRSKTGNLWCNLDSFEKKPNKYSVLLNEQNPERMKKYQTKVLHSFDEEKCPKSCLSLPVKELMKSIADGDLISWTANLDETRMPLGMVSLESCNKAKEILDQIEVILDKKTLRDSRTNTSEEYTEIQSLSNEYYMLLPPSNYAFEAIGPINNENQLNKYKKKLSVMTDLSISYRILLGAQLRFEEMSPYDYCYFALNIRLEEMSPKCLESQLISKFIYREGRNQQTDIENVFRVQQYNGNEYRSDLKNKKLLWHGTDITHMMSILKDGLQRTPETAFRTGSSLGKGIYFSWDFGTAYGFARGQSKYAYVLLCEVALGEMEYFNYGKTEIPPKDADSLWCHTNKIPNPERSIVMPYGAQVLIGEEIENKNNDGEKYFHHRHEAVVYNEKQVKIRYIVQVKK